MSLARRFIAGLLLTFGAGMHSPLADMPVQIVGLLVVTECRGVDYDQLARRNPSAEVLALAAGCAKMGMPVAVLSPTGESEMLYSLVCPSRPLAPYIAHQARITGEEVAPRVIVPKKVEIKGESGWMEVSITSMM